MKRLWLLVLSFLAFLVGAGTATRTNFNQIQWPKGPALIYVDGSGSASAVALDSSTLTVTNGVLTAKPVSSPPVTYDIPPVTGQAAYSIPIPASSAPKAVQIFYNGLLQKSGSAGDYTMSSDLKTVTLMYVPQSGNYDNMTALVWF